MYVKSWIYTILITSLEHCKISIPNRNLRQHAVFCRKSTYESVKAYTITTTTKLQFTLHHLYHKFNHNKINNNMGNPIWFIFWFLVFWFISFIVAGFSAFCYIILYALEVIFSGLSGINNFLLKCIQFPHFCAEAMLQCRSPC
ncbi:uncharacterized protein LOC118737843 isoform X2 [Rhagoletis pomonella]|uniref:uncharacterized protein LOC118737843 isoform X2 n=1 Tax=Rhagoletis pomonella TaxID=28610 RepID=UPI00177C0AE9|nr:uncharacterized protein LOC118737843 isoform X2 [Rhagoletis pomonella]